MTHSHHRRQEIERAARRMQVANLLASGVTDQYRIAEHLGVNQSTISRDIRIVESQWWARAAEVIATAKGKDLARTERLIAALWTDAINGKWRATDRVIALMQHRARLLGLNAPEKREDTHRVDISLLVQRIAEETGLNAQEILAEAKRILQVTGGLGDA